jgi:hypothetical protein
MYIVLGLPASRRDGINIKATHQTTAMEANYDRSFRLWQGVGDKDVGTYSMLAHLLIVTLNDGEIGIFLIEVGAWYS